MDQDINFESIEYDWEYLPRDVDNVVLFLHTKTVDSIEYEYEGADYWQSPEESYYLGAGDCEDMCIYFAYLYYMLTGDDSVQLVLWKTTNLFMLHMTVYFPGWDRYVFLSGNETEIENKYGFWDIFRRKE
ncbi:MAG: hypothetical protein GF311_28500 [Candidatus Lokiarchaeota archaeon]|nr:hypothetical protein [Candidatus Lokiarchaeota archaeon]